jgi:hypothetical protein
MDMTMIQFSSLKNGLLVKHHLASTQKLYHDAEMVRSMAFFMMIVMQWSSVYP